MLEQEREFYDAHIHEWIDCQSGRFVVVKNAELIGFFDSLDEALSSGAARFGLSSFMVRQIGESIKPANIPALTLGLLHADS
jgi:hypothetical protein